MLEYGKLLNFESQLLPPLLYRRFVIPSAQVLTSFTTPAVHVI